MRAGVVRMWTEYLRPVVVFTLVCLSWWAIGPWNYVHAMELSRRADAARPAPKDQPAAARLEAALREIERLLDRLGSTSAQAQPAALSNAQRQRLRAVGPVIDSEGQRIVRQLERIGERLKAEKLSKKVRDRQRTHIDRARQTLTPLREALDDLAVAKPPELVDRLETARQRLRRVLPSKPHNALDPNRLPHRSHTAPPASIRRTDSELRATHRPSSIMDRATAPSPADLAETVDVRITPAIEELAASLDHNPLNIYNWVRQNIVFVPTFGSIQGAEGCRLSLECNAHDTASLLIALLRSSEIPARYVTGTVELEPKFFRSAMGDFQDLQAAGRLAASGGIPTVTVVDASKQVVGVQIDHAWVEAFVDYGPSRGLGQENDTWVPLDAALKGHRFQAPVDLEDLTGISVETITSELDGQGTVGTNGSLTSVPTDRAQQQMIKMIEAVRPALDVKIPDATGGEIFGGLTVDADLLPLLPASLQSRVISIKERRAELPSFLRHRVVLEILDEAGNPLNVKIELPTARLANQRLTLSYAPATEEDVAVLESFGGLYETPPYLFDVEPQVLLEGEPLAAGSAVSMGSTQRLRLTFHELGRSDHVEHLVSAGTFAAVGLDLQRVSREQTEGREARLKTTQEELLNLEVDTDFDDVVGEVLHLHGQAYFQQVEAVHRLSGHQAGVRGIKQPAEGLVVFEPRFSFLFDSPIEVVGTGFAIDVRRVVLSAASMTGDREREREHVLYTGSASSAAEHAVFEMLQGVRSVSAVKLLAEANAQGIPIYGIDQANLDQVLPLLEVDPEVRTDVINAVNAGKTVTVSQRGLQFLNWSGLGYVVLDPETGAAAYLISGGLAGGGTAEEGEGDGVLSDLVLALVYVGNLVGVKGVVKALAKITLGLSILEVLAKWLGRIAVGVSAVYTFFTMWQETGSLLKGLIAGGIDLGASVLLGAIIGTALIGSLGPLAGAFIVITLSVAFTIILSLINDFIAQSGSLAWQHRPFGYEALTVRA